MSDRNLRALSVILVLSGVVGAAAWCFDATPKHSAGTATVGFLVMLVAYAIGRTMPGST